MIFMMFKFHFFYGYIICKSLVFNNIVIFNIICNIKNDIYIIYKWIKYKTVY